jgi:hypothetical protein
MIFLLMLILIFDHIYHIYAWHNEELIILLLIFIKIMGR